MLWPTAFSEYLTFVTLLTLQECFNLVALLKNLCSCFLDLMSENLMLQGIVSRTK